MSACESGSSRALRDGGATQWVAFALSLVLVAGCSKAARGLPKPLRIAAAADLKGAFGDVADAFEKKGGAKPTYSFGSTGLLAKQIQEGGPFDVFAAANVSYVDDVVKAGVCDGATKTLYARGRIVVWTSNKSNVAPPASVADLQDARFTKVAIANPDHAPYGKAAEQALEHAGVLSVVKPKLVLGENVQQTLQFAETGNVEAAIVALSLAVVAKDGVFVTIDESLHAPIDQAMVVCKNGGSADLGKQFAEFVSGPGGRPIMKRYGFLLPGETLARTP
jgi:molybdate transport system substrate-binding protein